MLTLASASLFHPHALRRCRKGSTFLKVLAGRYDPDKVHVKGKLHYNEHNCSSPAAWVPDWSTSDHIDNACALPPQHLRQRFGFCYEGDLHVPELSVAQTIVFAANAGLPASAGPKGSVPQEVFGKARKKLVQMFVGQVCRDLGILGVADTIVGNELIRGISGGQKKRVTIAEIFASKPPVIFLDGYTKGLDSATALGIAETLKTVTEVSKGTFTVVASQYQASQEIFELFDKVMVLQKDETGGPSRCVYFGGSKPSECENYFQKIGYPKPDGWTWPDYLGTLGFDAGRKATQLQRDSIVSQADAAAAPPADTPECTPGFAKALRTSEDMQKLRDDILIGDHLHIQERLVPKGDRRIIRQSKHWRKQLAQPRLHSWLDQLQMNISKE